MGALGLALVSGLCWGTGDFFGGLMTRRRGVVLVGAVSQTAGLVVTGVLIVLSGSPMPSHRALAFAAAAGVCGAVGLGALYQGLAVGPMSVVAPITALGAAVPVITGLARGERPTPVQLVGIAIGVLGVVLAARETAGDDEAVRGRVPGAAYGVVAAVLIGLLLTFLHEAGKESAPWAAFCVRLVSAPIFGAALVATRGWRRRPTGSEMGTMIGVGVLDSVGNVLFAFAGRTGLLTLISVLGSLYPVATVLLAWMFLRERLTRSQWVGVAMALVGVALIAG
jgi:drug/metabolite transporter (DMT)-like permease